MVFLHRYNSSEEEDKRDILVFHCEFSSKRGPDYCAKLRTKDRNVIKDVYPGLHYPEVYLLLKGYKEFWTHHPDLCEGGYTEMDNPRFSNHLRTCRFVLLAHSSHWTRVLNCLTASSSKLLPIQGEEQKLVRGNRLTYRKT